MCAVSSLVNVLQQKYWMCLWWCAAYKLGLMDWWTDELLNCWTVELLNFWTAELLNCWTAELLNCWTAELLNCWAAELDTKPDITWALLAALLSLQMFFYSIGCIFHCIPNTPVVTLCRCWCRLYVQQSCHELRWALIEALCTVVYVLVNVKQLYWVSVPHRATI